MPKQPEAVIVFQGPAGSERPVAVFVDGPAAIEFAHGLTGPIRVLSVPFYRYKVGRIKESTS